MVEISIDLSKQTCSVFNLEENLELLITNKNFIFGKNGTGKSTLCKLISSQFQQKYDVRIFTGFESVLTDDKLNAVVLGEENAEIKQELDKVENELAKIISQKRALELEYKTLNWEPEYEEEGILKNEILVKHEEARTVYEQKLKEIDAFYQEMARRLKQMSNPQITKTTYNKNGFITDISNAKEYSQGEIENCKEIMREQTKTEVTIPTLWNIDFYKLINETNKLIQYSLEEVIIIEELGNNPDKKLFANHGRKIHTHGEKCAFCGNIYTHERSQKLESYFSVPALKAYQEKLQMLADELEKEISNCNKITFLVENKFYSPFQDSVKQCNELLKKKQKEIIDYLNLLLKNVKERQANNFVVKKAVEINIPENYDNEMASIKNIIKKNNEYSEKLEKEQFNKREALRLHYVNYCLNLKDDYKIGWKGYEVEIFECKELKKNAKMINDELNIKRESILGNEEKYQEGTLCFLNQQLQAKEIEKSTLINKTRNTSILAKNINAKLKQSGKQNLQLELQSDPDEIEYYLIKDEKNGVRPINQISTGEKNIIAFLYFMENLSVAGYKNEKIILFDDPMNSNDDTMQYLIITEIQKLYQGKYREKFNVTSDYFICLTHNAHFYLNVQPHGNFKEKKQDPNDKTKLIEVSKYTKNNFYRIINGTFFKVLSEKEDLNTHYEYLWMELINLYENDLINSMLNSMRRIIETYTKFNKVNPQLFYKEKEEQQKLFNVNSHSIDDLSAELIGQTKEELLVLFKQVFYDNSAKEHFDSHWKYN